MPWLNLLAEDEGETGCPRFILLDGGNDFFGQGAEELRREGAAVVDVKLEGVCGMRCG